ncbi:MAG: SPOR domain-containing protein [Burkholderiales bacterium]
MAKPVSEEELQLKKRARRRLMGAIVLVAAVAVVLPMVLDSEPKPTSQEINIQIPSPDSKGFTSKVVPLTPPAKSAADGKGESKDKPMVKSPEKVAAKTADKSAEQAAEKPAAKAAEKTAVKAVEPSKAAVADEKAATKPVPEKAVAKAPEKAAEKALALKPGTFFIQVTALADTQRAKAVQQRIADAGLPAYTQAIPAGTGNVTRVRAGPFATRADAEKAQAVLQGIGLEGKVAEVK